MYIPKLLVTTSAMLLVSLVGSLTQYQPQRVLAQSQTQIEKRTVTHSNNPSLDFENKILHSLNLTPNQTQKIQAVQEKYKTELQQKSQTAMTASAELRKMVDGDATTEQVRSKHRSVSELQQQVNEERFECQLAIRDVLTVEQRRQRTVMTYDYVGNKILHSLNLTPDQTQKIQAVQEKYKTELQQQSQTAMNPSTELMNMMDDDATTEQVRSKHRSIEELQQQASNLYFEQQLAIRDILTVEQRRQRLATIQNPTLIRALLSSP